MDSIDELQTIRSLVESPISAFALHQAYETKLLALIRYLLLEIKDTAKEEVNFTFEHGYPTLNEFVGLLVTLTNEKRLERKLEPLSIIY